MGIFKFKDKTSEDFGLVVQTPPTYSYPERDVTITHIPGRDGDIIIDNKFNLWDIINKPFNCIIIIKPNSIC